MPEIKITCDGTRYVPIEALKPFQGNLKVLSKKELDKLKRQLISKGFSFPVFVWNDFILDGHNRVFAVKELTRAGYTIGAIPVVDIEAKNRQEAAEKILALNSHYARITDAGLFEFISENTLNILELSSDLSLPHIDMDSFLKDWWDDLKIDKKESKKREEISEIYAIYIECENEREQLTLLSKFETEGIKCRALIS